MKLATSAAACLIALAVSASAFAADAAPSKPLTPQQQRMKDCNAQAEGKKGDERKAFMSQCLKGQTAAATPAKPKTQQEKMKACNVSAGDKKGDERKAYMSTCLKGDGAAAPAAH